MRKNELETGYHKHEQFFLEAAREAQKALCLRSRCGAVVVQNGMIIGRGYNAPPNDDVTLRKCERDFQESPKPKSDRTCCMHAEWRAIIQALQSKKNLHGSMLYFARVNDRGEIKKSGEPYCTVCSRLALDTGIKQFGLWQEAGIKLYDTMQYNELSYQFHLKKQ